MLKADEIVREIGRVFPTFGGGRDSDMNPFAHAMKDQPLMFAAGVDVRMVVEYVLDCQRWEPDVEIAKTVAARKE